MHGPLWRDRTRVILLILSLSGMGCKDGKQGVDSSAVRPDSMSQLHARGKRTSASIVAEAESLYTYGPERPQLAANDTGFPGPYVEVNDSLPRMWISTATLKDSTHEPSTRIVARIRSERAYHKAGIDSGYNYVWRSTWRRDSATAASWETKIVSHDTTSSAYVLTRDARKHEYTHGDPKEPRLVRVKVHSFGFGACFDDPICPTGHCGYY